MNDSSWTQSGRSQIAKSWRFFHIYLRAPAAQPAAARAKDTWSSEWCSSWEWILTTHWETTRWEIKDAQLCLVLVDPFGPAVQSLCTISIGRTGATYNQAMQPNSGIGARGLLWNFVLTGISETGCGWWFETLRTILVSWDDYSQDMEKSNMFQTTNQWLQYASITLVACRIFSSWANKPIHRVPRPEPLLHAENFFLQNC